MDTYIPFQLRTLITQIDPRLDYLWQNHLTNIFSKISQHDKENIYHQILVPKNIQWNDATNEFSCHSLPDLEKIVNHIPHSGMKALSQKILISLKSLESYDEVLQIADYLESVITQIDHIDVEENIELQRLKLNIRTEFIYSAATIIRQKDQLKLPTNCRHLTSDCVKSFILEVYLKQQLLSFWFKALRPRELAKQPHPLLQHFLKEQQRLRQLEVVRTSRYIFALAPNRDLSINVFSIRRFLEEEKLAFSSNVYLNGAILDLTQINNTEHAQQFQWQISRIITVEKQISAKIIDLVDKIETYNADQLVPLLFKKFDASGLSIDKVVQQRLWDFEQGLTIHILEKLDHGLRHIAVNNDECDYLFVSTRQLLADIISYFKEFQMQPAIMFDNRASGFSSRLLAYLTLLQKRQMDIFVKQSHDEWVVNIDKMSEPMMLLKKTCVDALEQHKVLILDIKDKQRDVKNKENSFMNKLFKTNTSLQEKINDLKSEAFELRQNTYINIVKIPKKYPSFIVYLEFESLISLNDKERHYAFSTGQNWVKRLPILVQLPEDRSLFNLQELYNTLEFDLSKMNQKWADAS